MTVRLYDTQAQALRDFTPREAGHVTMYVCGPTVQSGPGIHHLRAALAFDLLRRSLRADWLINGYGPTEGTVCATAWRCPLRSSACPK